MSWPGTDSTALNFDSGQEGAAGEGELSVPLNEERVKIEIEDVLFYLFIFYCVRQGSTEKQNL